MQNPYFRAVKTDGNKVDVNLLRVTYFGENSDGSTTIHFDNSTSIMVKESAQTIRGRTRKTWPEAEVISGE